tara:strand:- start:196 stop:537 length:342 start_codon:yes stop_codon:yes gene_type:complete
MPKLPKCAYVKGDLVNQAGQMGVVTEADDDFFTYQLIGNQPFVHTSMNVTVKHYLKLVKAQIQIKQGRGQSSDFVARNVTLEGLLESSPDNLINGELDRLSEVTINKTVEQGE